MSSATTPKHRPQHPIHDVPDELVPGSMPVEPDEGPVPAPIPDDPEDDRVIDPSPEKVKPGELPGSSRRSAAGMGRGQISARLG